MSHFAHLKELTTKGVGLAVVQDIAAVEGGERIGAYLGENSSIIVVVIVVVIA